MDYNFKHYLVINKEEIEILEPINFDASSFVVEQDKKKWGRDIYKGNEEISLYFGDEIGEPLENERLLNSGMILRHKTSGLDFLLQINKEQGSEAVVYWKLQFGTEFLLFELDFGTAKTDDSTFIELKVIQNLEQAKIKRREKVKIDAFATKDLDNNDIAPITTHKMLLKAKPIEQVSEWGEKEATTENFTGSGFSAGIYMPITGNLQKYKVENSFVPFENYVFLFEPDSNTIRSTLFNNRILTANSQLSNLNINIKNISYNAFSNYGGIRLVLTTGFYDVNGNFISAGTTINISTDFSLQGESFNITIPSLVQGESLSLMLICFFSAGTFLNFNQYIRDFYCESVTITATSTAISSTINAVRYIDLIKQNYKAIGATPVIAPKFDVGGEFYNNFCFNGKLIRQLSDPFYLELSDTLESLEEFCADSQINETNNYIGQYSDFYANVDLGGFLVHADKDLSIEKNERYLINKFTFGYEKYQKDNSDKDDTLDAIHTDSEWYVPNNKSQNEKKISLPFSRDPFLAEYLRRRVVNSTTAETDDDTIFIFDVMELAPNSRENLTAVLKYQASGTTLKLLANGTFSWDLLGFQVGDSVIDNGVTRNVIEITPTLLTLSWSGGSASGEALINLNYPLTNVQYTIRTNEQLTFSENILNANNYGNLRYSIKRNIKHWENYLATAGKFIPSKEITNSFFKANGNAITKFVGETENIKENAPISISSISNKKIVSQNLINTTVTASFERVKKLLEDLQKINPDNSIGGFIRVQDQNGRIVKGYIKKLDNNWKFEELNLQLEERNESDFLEITYSNGTFTINEVGYSTKIVQNKHYNIFNDYIQFFDENNINLCNRTKYNQISLNGVIYDSSEDLAIAIDSL